MSSALTVLKQEIPSPFGNDQVKKIVKASPLNKEQMDEISQIEQAASGATMKNGNNTGTNSTATNLAASNSGASPNANIVCHLNGNSNSSTSNDLVNCLESVGQPANNQNDPNDERNVISMCHSHFPFWKLLSLGALLCERINNNASCSFVTEAGIGQNKDEKSVEESK